MRLSSDHTLSSLPAPIMLLTSVLQVEAKASVTIQSSPDTPLTMFETARDLSPRCSIYTKSAPMARDFVYTLCEHPTEQSNFRLREML